MADPKLDILAIAAHPDDAELSCAGTLIKHKSQGKKVGILDLTLGELGSRGSAEIRQIEAAASAEILGLDARVMLDLGDGFFEINEASLKEVITHIRRFKPEIVLCNATSDRHPDHGRGSELASRACFLSGLVKVETIFDGELQEKWRPKAVYHYIQDRHIDPDIVIDVSNEWEQKLDSIRAFSSQFFDPDSDQPETPISSKGFWDYISARGNYFGRNINVEYGEGYTVERAIGVDDLTTLI
ncbi:MAG: bacillithiol biosynthesis deacetylase BshB1 [Flavobacteriales bacterium]|nr:bacillithiol biosynthesis deacetylase BshB1 [Flavobacteriales bacterium]